MKIINKNIAGIVIVLFALAMASCKKDSYLNDGGLNSTTTSLSTYDYLKNNPQFDTMALLIDHFNLKDSVNKAKSLFAFTDYNIAKFMRDTRYTTLKTLYDSVSSKMLTQYMFGESITLENATTNAVQHINWAGAKAPVAISKKQGTDYVYLTSSAPAFNYYSLEYIKINGVLDGSPGAPSSDLDDTYIVCQSSGLNTSSGTTVHVLVNNAPLNKL